MALVALPGWLSELSPLVSWNACWWGRWQRWRWRQLIESSPEINYYWEITKTTAARTKQKRKHNKTKYAKWMQGCTHMGICVYLYSIFVYGCSRQAIKTKSSAKTRPSRDVGWIFINLSQTCRTSPAHCSCVVIFLLLFFTHTLPKICATDRQFAGFGNASASEYSYEIQLNSRQQLLIVFSIIQVY